MGSPAWSAEACEVCVADQCMGSPAALWLVKYVWLISVWVHQQCCGLWSMCGWSVYGFTSSAVACEVCVADRCMGSPAALWLGKYVSLITVWVHQQRCALWSMCGWSVHGFISSAVACEVLWLVSVWVHQKRCGLWSMCGWSVYGFTSSAMAWEIFVTDHCMGSPAALWLVKYVSLIMMTSISLFGHQHRYITHNYRLFTYIQKHSLK